MGSLPDGKISFLWIALAIALGLLLLTIITAGLKKVTNQFNFQHLVIKLTYHCFQSGFFNRNKRDELQLLWGQIATSVSIFHCYIALHQLIFFFFFTFFVCFRSLVRR